MNKDYDNDFRVHDLYVSFSAEIARIAMLSPLVLGFMFSFFFDGKSLETFRDSITPIVCFIISALVALGLSIFFALLHRYAAAEFMENHVNQNLNEEDKNARLSVYGGISQISILLAPLFLCAGYLILFWGLGNFLLLGS